MFEDPTSRGDRKAYALRAYYEANRESWWERFKRRMAGGSETADNLMLGLMNEADKFERENPVLYRDSRNGE